MYCRCYCGLLIALFRPSSRLLAVRHIAPTNPWLPLLTPHQLVEISSAFRKFGASACRKRLPSEYCVRTFVGWTGGREALAPSTVRSGSKSARRRRRPSRFAARKMRIWMRQFAKLQADVRHRKWAMR